MVDLLVAVVGMPLFIFVLVGDIKGDANCAVNSVIIHVPHLIAGYSLMTLSALNFERYMGILHPFVHRTKLTKKKLLFHVAHSCVSHTVTVLMFYLFMNVRRLVIAIVIPVFLVETTFMLEFSWLPGKDPRKTASQMEPQVDVMNQQQKRRRIT